MSSSIGLNICAIISMIKKYRPIIKKKKKKYDEKANLNFIKSLFSKYLRKSYIERNYFILIDVLRKHDYVKKEVNKLETS